MNWFKSKSDFAVDENTQDRKELIVHERRKLRQAQQLAAALRAHDRVNNYSQRLRHAYALAAADEGAQ